MAELFQIAEARGPKSANVIFFHGLGGDAHTTWQADKDDKATFWLPWLAQDIEGLSVYSVGYEAPASDRDHATMHPATLASNALNRLLVDPRLREDNIILIGHSLGGLIIKMMLRKAELEHKEAFLERVRKVIFLATPHSGADLARLANLLRILVRPSSATLALSRNDAYLRELNEGYRDLARDREIAHLVLTEHKPLIVRYEKFGITWFHRNLGMIVKPDQADPGVSTNPIPIPADHIEIAKPVNRDSEIYLHIRQFIERHVERHLSPEEQKVDAVKDDTQAILENIERIVALLDKRELAQAAEAGLERQTILQLARRLKPGEIIDFEQAVRELENAIGIALDVIAKGERGTNQEAFVEDVLKRLAETTKKGDFDAGAKTVDDALAALDRQADSLRRSRETLLEAGVEQDLLRRDPTAVARRIEAIAALNTTDGNPAWSQTYRERFNAFLTIGEDKGINLSLEVAIELARRMVASARNGNQRGEALKLLGDALFPLGERETGTVRLEEAATAYRAASKEKTRERDPLEWAAIQNNLGNALKAIGDREVGVARLNEAVAAYRAALSETPRHHLPLDWAKTQSNLGNVLLRLGERETSTKRLRLAITAYEQSLLEGTRERAPLDWARTQMNMGNALRVLASREGGTTRLEHAVGAFEQALKELTREKVPLEWAKIKQNLGAAYRALGEREEGTTHLVKSVDAYNSALEERTRQRAPLQWAMTKSNLGSALATLGARESGTERLRAAVAVFHEALEERNKNGEPHLWATTQINLGNALLLLGEREGGTQRLEEAVAAFEKALTVFNRSQEPAFWQAAQGTLKMALAVIDQRKKQASSS